ncbi:hypothetical protein [uncultured Tenacibaculum sp.]|uniref:hypothetical protein n=1 Tax=uncultured Tenacibaculum sp. TaxID=174713 RepID=UPI002628C564|nr:hypothetical protein [uncultured Tenacibaculum sp.]
MDLLEKYKEAWDNQPENSNKVSKGEIYKMMKSKSSSIVKWIFIIGLIEFILISSSYFFLDIEESIQAYENIGLNKYFMLFNTIAGSAIVLYFLYRFYINYRSISTTENTKSLMNQILNTRKTVRNYVLINLTYLAIFYVIATILMVNKQFTDLSTLHTVGIIIASLIALAVMLTVIWLIYQLLYGILLNKLNKNYKDLAKLDE